MIIKTLQWNIGGGYIKDKNSVVCDGENIYTTSDINYILNILKKNNPDVIFLQETHSSNSFSQVKFIAESLGYEYFNDVYAESHIEKGQLLGQAIISRFPLKEHTFEFFVNPNLEIVRTDGEKWISHDKGVSRCYAEIENEKSIFLETLHMVPFRKFNADPILDAPLIIKDVENKIFKVSDALLLQGDFNLDENSLVKFFPTIFNNGIKEIVLDSPTTPSGKMYDHVLFNGIRLLSFKIDADALTDHFPLIAEFDI